MDYAAFLGIFLVICVPVAVGAIWYKLAHRRKRKRKRKHRHKHAQPTLAQKGGLPPMRPPGQMPPKP